MGKKWKIVIGVLAAVMLFIAAMWFGFMYFDPAEVPVARSYTTGVYKTDGGDKLVVQSGGEIEIQSGATLDVQVGVTTDFSGGIDLDGALLDLDADGDTSITADTDDEIDVEINGSDEYQFDDNVFTIGDAAEEDSQVTFDGNAQDYYLGLDDSADDLVLGLGSTIETTEYMTFFDDSYVIEIGDATENDAGFYIDGNAQDFYVALDDTEDDLVIGVGNAVGTTPAIAVDENQDVTLTEQLTVNGVLSTYDKENIGLPTVLKVEIDIDNDSSPYTCATVADGEIWFVHTIYANVLDNFATGGSNDATLDVGDGNDADGLLDLDDAELQAADVDVANGTAGWQGYGADTIGAFMAAGAGFIYAPSGAAETIDCAFAGTGLASDTADTSTDVVIYIVYTRTE